MAAHSSILAGNVHGQQSLESLWNRKESDTTEHYPHTKTHNLGIKSFSSKMVYLTWFYLVWSIWWIPLLSTCFSYVIRLTLKHFIGRFKPLPGGLVVKNPPATVGDPGSFPVLGRSPGEGNDIPHQYSCLGNPRDRGAWWAIVHGVAKSQTRLSD